MNDSQHGDGSRKLAEEIRKLIVLKPAIDLYFVSQLGNDLKKSAVDLKYFTNKKLKDFLVDELGITVVPASQRNTALVLTRDALNEIESYLRKSASEVIAEVSDDIQNGNQISTTPKSPRYKN